MVKEGLGFHPLRRREAPRGRRRDCGTGRAAARRLRQRTLHRGRRSSQRPERGRRALHASSWRPAPRLPHASSARPRAGLARPSSERPSPGADAPSVRASSPGPRGLHWCGAARAGAPDAAWRFRVHPAQRRRARRACGHARRPARPARAPPRGRWRAGGGARLGGTVARARRARAGRRPSGRGRAAAGVPRLPPPLAGEGRGGGRPQARASPSAAPAPPRGPLR